MNKTAESEQTVTVEEEEVSGIIQLPPLLLSFLTPTDIAPPDIRATDTWSTGPDEGADYCDT